MRSRQLKRTRWNQELEKMWRGNSIKLWPQDWLIRKSRLKIRWSRKLRSEIDSSNSKNERSSFKSSGSGSKKSELPNWSEFNTRRKSSTSSPRSSLLPILIKWLLKKEIDFSSRKWMRLWGSGSSMPCHQRERRPKLLKARGWVKWVQRVSQGTSSKSPQFRIENQVEREDPLWNSLRDHKVKVIGLQRLKTR